MLAALAAGSANAADTKLDEVSAARELGFRAANRCANNGFRCPSNSRKMKRCPQNFSDCRCRRGFGVSAAGAEACVKTLTLEVTNLSYLQPFGGFFVMVHNEDADPLYVFGEESTSELADLAENGSPAGLVALYDGADGVLSATAFGSGPLFPGESASITVEVNSEFDLVTIASMAINTNDCFVAINGMKLYSGAKLTLPGLDSGSEANNERCPYIPGPACSEPADAGNLATPGMGEGFVHVHRGFHGINVGADLPDGETALGVGYDWSLTTCRSTWMSPVVLSVSCAPARRPCRAGGGAGGACRNGQTRIAIAAEADVRGAMDKYDVVRRIGQGAFGEVTECVERASGARVAVKVISNKRYETWEECLKLREVRALRQLGAHHKSIVVLRQIVRENKKLFLVFDYHPSNLYQRIKALRKPGTSPPMRFTATDVARWGYQLLSALAYMHRYGFFHRDIKPENLLLDVNDGIQVCDFGLARDVRSRPPFTDYVSTKWYRAPELVLRFNVYNSPVDIWACGCVLAELLTLQPLFPAADKKDHLLLIQNRVGSISPQSWPQGNAMLIKQHIQMPRSAAAPKQTVAESLAEEYGRGAAADDSIRALAGLVEEMLQLDPNARLSATQCLNHRALKDCQSLDCATLRECEKPAEEVEVPEAREAPEVLEPKKRNSPVKVCRRDSELRILTEEIDQLAAEIQDVAFSPPMDDAETASMLPTKISSESEISEVEARVVALAVRRT
ncbi:Cyclin-dependent kinase F-4 (CDKF [Durusdinium trenchii]|uniref:Cyclin-dependent kinase F-4 (CDKF) n=1 Tax=Durusdinium trenchii TaxID=1381693 RepID=A0ABP0HHC2_9DINO